MTIFTTNELDILKKKDKKPVRTPTILPDKREKKKRKGKKERWEGEREREILVVLGFLNEDLCTWLDWESFLLVMFFSGWEMG